MRRWAAMSLLAHAGSGLVNTWGFAYVGGVIGLFAAALYFVHRTIAIRASSPQPANRSGPFRAIVPLGFVCGVFIGLGTGRLLESAIETTPTASELFQQICVAAESGRPDAFDAVHDDIDHYAGDQSNKTIARAHTNLDTAIVNKPEAILTEITRLLTTLNTPGSNTGASPCSTLSSEPQP